MPEGNKSFWSQYNYSLFWALFILILCGIPGDELPNLTFFEWLQPDKIVHLFLFGIFCFLLLKAFAGQNQNRFLQKNSVAFALVISISYGCVMEILQALIFIHRSGDIRDAAANAVGAFLGYWIYKKYFSRKEKPPTIGV